MRVNWLHRQLEAPFSLILSKHQTLQQKADIVAKLIDLQKSIIPLRDFFLENTAEYEFAQKIRAGIMDIADMIDCGEYSEYNTSEDAKWLQNTYAEVKAGKHTIGANLEGYER
jgi:hypothetical protein